MRTSIISIFYLLTVSFTYGQDDLHLPPVLQFTNGSEVKTVKDWRKRRASILSVFEHEVYGVSPRLPKCVRYSIQSENNNALKGKATMKRVNLYLKNMSNPLELLIYYPNNRAKKVPAFLGLNFWGNYTVTDDKDVFVGAK